MHLKYAINFLKLWKSSATWMHYPLMQNSKVKTSVNYFINTKPNGINHVICIKIDESKKREKVHVSTFIMMIREDQGDNYVVLQMKNPVYFVPKHLVSYITVQRWD